MATKKQPKKKAYPPLAVRLKKKQQAEDAKAMREAEEAIAKAKGLDKPVKAPPRARPPTRADEAKADRQSGSLGAAIDQFISAHGPGKDDIGDGEAAVVADFLQPYVERLKKLERRLPDFPETSDLPWWEVESAVLDISDPRTINKVGVAFGIDRHRMYEMSKKRKWKDRRKVLQELRSRKSTMKALAEPVQIISGNGTSLQAKGPDAEDRKFVKLVEDCITVFTEGMKQGMVEFKTARDLDTLMRLMHFLEGKADKIEEQRTRVSPAQFKEIVAEVVKQTRFSPAAAGVVVDADYEIIGDEPNAVADVGLQAIPGRV